MFFAIRNGGHLASFVAEIMLGITDDEGEWKTFDGETLQYTNWDTENGEPKGGISKKYAFLNTLQKKYQNFDINPAGTWNLKG